MDYVTNNVTVSVEKNTDTGRATMIAYDMAHAAMKDERKEEKENA